MKLIEIYEQDYLPNNLRIRSDCTKRHYAVTFNQLRQFLGRDATTDDLTDQTATKFARWLIESKPRSAYTANQRLDYFRAIWRFCAKRRIVDQWPTYTNVPEPEIVPRAWTEPQLAKLFDACRRLDGEMLSIPESLWWLNLHKFLWQSGERIGATLAITWDMVDPDGLTIDVPARIRKGRHRGMLYQISRDLMDDLLEMRRPAIEHHFPQVFPWPKGGHTIWNRYEKILKSAGLPTDRRSKLHRMRKSFASHLKRAGGDPTYAMRHSSAAVTEKSYLDPSIAGDEPSHTKLPKIDESPAENPPQTPPPQTD